MKKTKIMASGPIASWEIDGETVEIVSDFIFLGSKITADGDFSHEIKRRLLLGRKVMTNLDSIFKSRDITLPTQVHLVKAMVFNMLPRLVMTFLPRSKHLLISWLKSPSAVILEPPKIKSDTVSTVSPSISYEVMGPNIVSIKCFHCNSNSHFSDY